MLVSLLTQYGYAVLAVTVFCMNAGIPFPGHAAYIAACALASDGTLSLPLVVASGVGPAFFGAWTGFALGKRGGRKLVDDFGPRLGLSVERRALVDRFFARHGALAVFFGRFVIIIRTFGNVLAGVAGYPTARFLLITAAGALVWGAVYAALGTFFRASWNLVEEALGESGLIVLGLLAVGLILLHFLRRRRRRKNQSA